MDQLLNNGLTDASELALLFPLWKGVLLATVCLGAPPLLRQQSQQAAHLAVLCTSILLAIAGTAAYWHSPLALLATGSKLQEMPNKSSLDTYSNSIKGELYHTSTAHYYFTYTDVQEPLADELHQILLMLDYIEEKEHQ